MRVLVTGSRNWADLALVHTELERVFQERSEGPFVVVHGACPGGADAHASAWVVQKRCQGWSETVSEELHPADWDGPAKKGAGFKRNADMVRFGADVCLAFILDESKGATHTAELAAKAGIHTEIFTRRTTVTTAVKRVENEITLENVRLMWRNFAGEERLYNDAGKRNFVIPLDEPLALELREIGWNVRDNSKKVASGEHSDLLYTLDVTVKFGKRPPRIFMITKSKNKRTPLDEDTVMHLDYAEFDSVDVIIRPFNWDVNGKQGVSAYLKTLFATIHEDDLEKKYAHVPIDGEPLEIENVIDVEGDWVEDDQLALPRGEN